MINNKILVPPIKIQGIKTKLVRWILEQINFQITGKWIEPFMGSGVVGFNYKPYKALFADINPHIINFYNSIKEGKITAQKVKNFLEQEGEILSRKGADYYYYVRDRFNEKKDPLDFLFLNRASFNGLVRFNGSLKFNTPFGHKPSRFSKSYITKIVNQVKNIEICLQIYDWEFVCQDFRITLSNISKDDFIYCDPPYIGRHVDYYDSWNEKDELSLYNMLSLHRGKFILSTWHSNKFRKNEYINNLWNKFYIITKEHFYHIGAREDNRNPMIEALVMNFKPKLEINNLNGKKFKDQQPVLFTVSK